MKIGNEFIKIKMNNKERIFKNLILNSYLDLFAAGLLNNTDKTLLCCFIKFDNKQNINVNSTSMQYDIYTRTINANIVTITTEQSVINTYNYIFAEEEIKNFIGRKIFEIGFGQIDRGTAKIYAYLDVSNYDLEIQNLQDIVITRVDKIESDAVFRSNNTEVKVPLHLMLNGKTDINSVFYNYRLIPQLEGIGFSYNTNKVESSINIDDFDILKENGELTFIAKDEFKVKRGNYIVFIFKILKQNISETELINTYTHYYQYIYNNKTGKVKVKIKFERI